MCSCYFSCCLRKLQRLAVVPKMARLCSRRLAVTSVTDAKDKARQQREQEVAARIPAKRVGTDEDMAGAAIYLASRAGDYVVGSTLIVDGGATYVR